MERTRIVHYTHSRTPVILSPTTTSPKRLPSSSSMSSLVSSIDEKAPLAYIDNEFPTTTRRSSKSGDSNGVRSSSTGRLLDESKTGHSDYTALRCQDLPESPSIINTNVDMRREITPNGDVRKERSRSDFTPSLNGKSPNTSMDDAMRRDSMGTWSKSRRKPQSDYISNSNTPPHNSSTLPSRGVNSTPSDTLVKSRRRYTWLSSRQSTSPQGPTAVRSLKHNESINDNSSVYSYSSNGTSASPSTLPRRKHDISNGVASTNPPVDVSASSKPSPTELYPHKQHSDSKINSSSPVNHTSQNGISPNTIITGNTMTFPRRKISSSNSEHSPISFASRNDAPHVPIIKSPMAQQRINNTSFSTDITDRPTTVPDVKSPLRQQASSINGTFSVIPSNSHSTDDTIKSQIKKHRDSSDNVINTSPSKEVSNSPKTDLRSESPSNYDWKRDPRRRPCNFVDAFGLSPPQSPPEPDPGTKDPPSLDYVNSDTGYSSPTIGNRHDGTTSSPVAKRPSETSFGSRTSATFDSEARNINSHSPQLSINSYKGNSAHDDDFIHEDKTPVNEIDPVPLYQSLSDTSSDNNDVFTHATPNENFKCNINSDFHPKSVSTNQNHLRSDDRHSGYRDCLVRNSLQLAPQSKIVTNQSVEFNKRQPFNNTDVKTNLSKKSKSVSVFSGGASDKSIENILKSPRTRNSFKIAVGSNWDDVFPAAESLSILPDISENKTLSPKKGAKDNTYMRLSSLDDDIFISCDDMLSQNGINGRDANSNESNKTLSEQVNQEYPPKHGKDSLNVNVIQKQEGECDEDYDSLTRRIKRNSMRLATASLSDLTYAIDDINIENNIDNYTAPELKHEANVDTLKTTRHSSPLHMRSNLSRTGSLLSSQNSSSFGSFHSCQSRDANSCKNSPSSNASHRKDLQSRLDSPMSNRIHNNYDRLNTSHPGSTRTSSPVSVASSGRSGHRQKPAYYWTRQAPYPRLLYARSSSVASSRGSGGYRASSPQPSTTSSIYTHYSHNSNNRNSNNNAKSNTRFTDTEISEKSKLYPNLLPKTSHESKNSHHSENPQSNPHRPTNFSSSRPIDRRSMTLPISNPFHSSDFYYKPPYAPDLSPSSVLESPNSNAVLSPPSLGRPRRKQYAGFDCQPLPMDSFMSDSSSVYTGVSCSSRATDMTGQPDNAHFDESFMSEDVQSCFEEDSRGDISFDPSETLQPSSLVSDVSKDLDESESKRSSIHSTSTTKQDNADSSIDEKCRDGDDSVHNISDELIENVNNHVSFNVEKQFGSEYDALFRLYKSDDLFTTPSYSLYSQNGKAFSSSCLLRAQLYSKRKFLSTRDIFDLIRHSNNTRLDGTVSLTSLERHAHKVCEAILCCDEITELNHEGYINQDTHSVV